MNDLVFLAPNTAEPFTTSEVIADCAQVQHHTVTRLIQTHEPDFKSFGILRFEIEEINGRGQPKKVYHLNEQQATLLMTYLRNTEVVRAFKKELVRQFYAMRQELFKVQAVKAERRVIRVKVTDAIQALPESPHKAWKYKQYTDLIYLNTVGMTAKQLREDRGAAKDAVASDYMTAGELSAVAEAENRVGVLIEAGMSYGQIKDFLESRRLQGVTA